MRRFDKGLSLDRRPTLARHWRSFAPRAIVSASLALADVQLDGRRDWDIHVHDERMFRKLLLKGSLAFGETYVEGAWDCRDLPELLFRILRRRQAALGDGWWIDAAQFATKVKRSVLNLQTKARSQQVVAMHYDLHPGLFESMLGPTMSYTCAYWPTAKTLEDAQRHKLDLICRKLELTPRHRVLDLGCGFGSFARFAAEHYGASVVGVNLSAVQTAYARNFCANLPVELHQCDYRDVDVYFQGTAFDRVVSIGMFEAVGHHNFGRYMQIVHRVLKDKGLWLLHTIGDEECSADPWGTRYIFPNGELPSLEQIARATRQLFHVEDVHNFGTDYERTLGEWDARFRADWPRVRQLNPDVFTDRFFRMWTYFLGCARGAFRARNIHLWQIVMSKGCLNTAYRSVR